MDTTETTNGATNEARGEALAVTVEEAARMLAVSSRTVYRLAKAGKVRIVRVTPDTPRVILASLMELLARAYADSPPETGGGDQARGEYSRQKEQPPVFQGLSFLLGWPRTAINRSSGVCCEAHKAH